MKLVLVFLSVLGPALFLAVQAVPAEKGGVGKGRALYEKHCAVCHGPKGKGDGYTLFDPPVADLTSRKIQIKSDEELRASVHDGVSNTAMGTWKLVLSDKEIALVLAYVRSLSQ